MTSPKITAAICTYDRYDLLPVAIESLTRQTLGPENVEIIVVDNSPDGEKAAEFAERFREIKNLKWLVERTSGLSNARNVAIRRSTASMIAFMDDDAIAAPDWLEQIHAAFDTFGPQAVAAGGQVVPLWEQPRPSWLHDELLGYLSVVDWGGTPRLAGPKEWVAGTNIAFRTDAIRSVGGFAVHLGRNKSGHSLLSNDETEVLAKLLADGGRLLYLPNAVVQHLVPADRLTQTWFRRRVAWQAVSEYIQHPKEMFDAAPGYWNDVLDFYSRLAPKYRTPRGLWIEQAEPEMFRHQLSALYNHTIAALAGFHSLEAL